MKEFAFQHSITERQSTMPAYKIATCTHIPGSSSHKHCVTIGRGLSTYLAAFRPSAPPPSPSAHTSSTGMGLPWTPHLPHGRPRHRHRPCHVRSGCLDVLLDDALRNFVIPESRFAPVMSGLSRYARLVTCIRTASLNKVIVQKEGKKVIIFHLLVTDNRKKSPFCNFPKQSL